MMGILRCRGGTAVFVAAALCAGSAAAQPANDECAGAIAIVNGLNAGFSNVGSTTSAPAWPCAAGGNDVWFSYVASCTGNATVSLCAPGAASYDSAIQAFSGTCAALVSLVCNDDFCALASQVTFAVTSGTTYYIRVGGFLGATGSFDINVTCTVPPPSTFDFGDARTNLAAHNQFSTTAYSERLGTIGSQDAVNPVTPSWWGDDDDGIVSVTDLFPGSTTATIVVSASNPGATYTDFCRMWVRRGSLTDVWSATTDALATQSASVGPAGTNFTFGPFTHSAAAAPSPYVRVRLSFDTTGVASTTGTGSFGEVEDYVLPGTGGPSTSGTAGDSGDAPLPYPPVNTTFTGSEHLGFLVTDDPNAPVGPSTGPAAFDDDGADDCFIRIDGLAAGGSCSLVIRAVVGPPATGTFTDWISAWMDFDGDGNWDEAGEVFTPVSGPVGPAGATFTLGPLPVPASAVNPVPTRVKLNFNTTTSPGYLASGASFTFGEIEDYLLPQQPGTACNQAGASTPTAWAEHPPEPGTPFVARGAGLVPSTGTLLSIGASTTTWFGIPLPVDLSVLLPGAVAPGCLLQASPDFILGAGATDPAGNVTTGGVPIPPDPTLSGVRIWIFLFQVVANPAPPPPLLVVMTPLVWLTIL